MRPIVFNRIKPHTDFRGRFESGLVKMTAIGLGKAAGAEEIHRFGVRGLRDLLPRAAERILSSGKIILGIGIVENAYDETMAIEALRPLEILQREPELLELARANMPHLPLDRLDLLIVDRIGKNISGTGMDTNIIGRMRIRGQEEPRSPDITMIVITDLTDDSHGNATGMGLADVATRRLFQKLERGVTNTNVVVSGFYERGKMPLIAETDRQAVEWALRGCGPISIDAVRVARIRDTLHLDELYVSPAVLAELVGDEHIDVIGSLGDSFADAANLHAF